MSKKLFLLLIFEIIVITAVFWYTQIDGKLYYCSDKIPLFDFVPPFVHGLQVGDYYIASPVTVYIFWSVLILINILIPFAVSKKIFKKRDA